jgi:glycosyltransferase involved in cell wall biosynthesis
MKPPIKIAIINEICTAGAARCARDIEHHLSPDFSPRYYPRDTGETLMSLRQNLQSFGPDVVHCHSYYGDLPYSFLADISRQYPTCFTVHDPRPVGAIHPGSTVCWNCPRGNWCLRCALVSRPRKLFLLNPYFWKRLYKRSVHWRTSPGLHIIAPSRWMEQRLLASELRRFPITHIPYGVDLEFFHNIPDARQKLNLSLFTPYLLYVAHTGGGWTPNPRKGLNYLADAFLQVLLPAIPDVRLLVAGEGLIPNHPQIQGLGFVSQDILPLYYSAANVFVAPTLADNLPYTVLEAMSCGTPVVASDIGGVSEEVEQGVTGYLVPSAQAMKLGTTLLRLLEDQTAQKKMGRAARRRVEQHFGMGTFVRRHEELYRKMFHQQRK